MDFFALMLTPFSHIGILIGGTLIFFILGWLWYNPITPVGKVWFKYFPMPKKMPDGSQMAIMMLFQVFMSFILAHTVMTLWIFIFQNNYHMFNHSIATDKISREGMAD
jgi:hypothetical protein